MFPQLHAHTLTQAKYYAAIVAGVLTAGWAGFQRFQKMDADFSVYGQSMPLNWWNEKVVWITGASGGIGEAFAQKVARLGACVILSARREVELQRVVASLPGNSHDGPGHMALCLDAEDFESHKAAVEAVWQRYGRLDIFLLNAGRGGAALAEDTEFNSSK
jgi:NADPH:quinone reductase-like Zn-dependent oxidoreductase